MSPRTVCKLEKFGECSKSLRNKKPWEKFCSDAHRTRFRYLVERRRVAKKRNKASPDACCTHGKRVTCRRYVEVGSIRKALMLLAEGKPEFFLRLAAGIPKAGKGAAD